MKTCIYSLFFILFFSGYINILSSECPLQEDKVPSLALLSLKALFKVKEITVKELCVARFYLGERKNLKEFWSKNINKNIKEALKMESYQDQFFKDLLDYESYTVQSSSSQVAKKLLGMDFKPYVKKEDKVDHVGFTCCTPSGSYFIECYSPVKEINFNDSGSYVNFFITSGFYTANRLYFLDPKMHTSCKIGEFSKHILFLRENRFAVFDPVENGIQVSFYKLNNQEKHLLWQKIIKNDSCYKTDNLDNDIKILKEVYNVYADTEILNILYDFKSFKRYD